MNNLEKRTSLALAIKEGERKVNLPDISGWNENHPLRPFQKIGVAWMYAVGKGILADPVGLGKTAQALGLVALLKSLGQSHRTVIVALNYKAQMQWADEIRKFTDLNVVAVHGSKSERISQISMWWDVLLTRYSVLIRDIKYLEALDFDNLICDETSYIRNHDNRTAIDVKRLAAKKNRVIFLDATPIQTSLMDMHSLLETFNWNIFGPAPAFNNRYIRREPMKFKRGSSWINATKIVGYKHMTEFKNRIAPFVFRRRLDQVEAELPETVVQNVWFELPHTQRKYYDDARKGMVNIWNTEEGRQRAQKIKAGFHHLQYACDSTITFDRANPTSVKLDWLINELKHDLRGQKVVVFAKYLTTIDHIMQELRRNEINARKFVGSPAMSNEEKDESVYSFWNDNAVQVLVGSSALERSLNLQKSAYMIAFNQLWNPQRQVQLFGRVRRIGSEHSRAILINLLTENTIEERLFQRMSERAAVADHVFDEASDIFESLGEEELMALIED